MTNTRDWMRLLTRDERRLLNWALADQDALIRRDGEQRYYENVTDTTGEVVDLESLRAELIGELGR